VIRKIAIANIKERSPAFGPRGLGLVSSPDWFQTGWCTRPIPLATFAQLQICLIADIRSCGFRRAHCTFPLTNIQGGCTSERCLPLHKKPHTLPEEVVFPYNFHDTFGRRAKRSEVHPPCACVKSKAGSSGTKTRLSALKAPQQVRLTFRQGQG